MIPRAALLVLILQFALSSFAQGQGVQPRQQAGRVAVEPQVLEAGAKTTLEKDTIRVMLPLSAAPDPGAKVVVWLASPTPSKLRLRPRTFRPSRRLIFRHA